MWLAVGIGIVVGYSAVRLWDVLHKREGAPDLSLTLPQVPGLLDRIKKEPGFAFQLLGALRANGLTQAQTDMLMSLISEESGFNPAAKNPTSGTVGFLQWMPAYFGAAFGNDYHVTSDQITGMTGTEQVKLLWLTLQHLPAYKTDPAMQGWGSHIGAPDSTVIAKQGEKTYEQNSVYDRDKKGFITAGDVRSAVALPLKQAQGKPRIDENGNLVSPKP